MLSFIGSSNGHIDTVKYFIGKRFDGNIKNDAGNTALHFGGIILFDHFYLLFLLFIGSSNGHIVTVKLLIEKRFDGNSRMMLEKLLFILVKYYVLIISTYYFFS